MTTKETTGKKLTPQEIVSRTVEHAVAALDERGGNENVDTADLRANLERIAQAIANGASTSGHEFQAMLSRTASLLSTQGVRDMTSGNDLLEAVRDAHDAISNTTQANSWCTSPKIRAQEEERVAKTLDAYRSERQAARTGPDNKAPSR